MSAINQKNTKGFTLMEILVALFIFAAIMSVILGAYTGTFKIMRDTEYQADIYQMARTALENIQEDLESAFIPQKDPQDFPFMGEDREVDGRRADSLSFFSEAHLVLDEEDKGGDRATIVYYVKECEEEDGFVLYRSDTPEFKERPEEGTGGNVICEGLYSLNLTYYDVDGEVHDDWDSTQGAPLFKDKVPARVSIFLELVNELNPEVPYKFMTGVALPMGG